MKSTSKTEEEMRVEVAPSPKTTEELIEYIESLTERDHDYGTCVYAMSLSATAAFKHVAHKLGATGFQAGCADLDVVRRTRRIEGPFIILKGEDMLYPQYDLVNRLREAMDEWRKWAAEEARKLISRQKESGESGESVSPRVAAHWNDLVSYDGGEDSEK
jgi:hypothetical protein